MTSAGNDIQEIGLFIMILPILALLPILVFGVWQLMRVRKVGKSARVRLQVD